MTSSTLGWQSKCVLLAVLPFVAVDVLIATRLWLNLDLRVAVWTLGLSALLGLVTWKLRAATPDAAATGAAITASLMFSTLTLPYQPWHTALVPVLAVSLLAFGATRVGRGQKERLGTAEPRKGRSAAQIAANLGVAALAVSDALQSSGAPAWLSDNRLLARIGAPLFALALAALAEAAADTVSSETGQVFGGRPRMITTLGSVEPGTDGAISAAGTLAGVAAAALIAGLGTYALRGTETLFAVSCAGGVFGLFFDSLLGATMERRGWLNNDAVNFLSTASAAGFALVVMAFLL